MFGEDVTGVVDHTLATGRAIRKGRLHSHRLKVGTSSNIAVSTVSR
jgi:hypothetical protein